MLHIKDGFSGQRLVVLPFYDLQEILGDPLSPGLVLHSVGYFPKAEGHYIGRPSGCGEYLLIYCTQGSGWFSLEGERHNVESNQFFLLPADIGHQYGSSTENPWYIYWAHFTGEKAPNLYQQLKGIHTITPDDTSRVEERIGLFDEILNTLETQTCGDYARYANDLFLHLIATFRYLNIYREVKSRREKQAQSYFISLATHYMNERIERKLTLSELAAHFGYSESHFYRLFYRETGYAPMNYFLHLKIERACRFLKNSDMKITQIAFKVGFEDAYYFSRIFSKMMGISPRSYRKQTDLSLKGE